MSAEVTMKFSRNMKLLLSRRWLNGKTLGFIAAGVVDATVGPSRIAKQHFAKGQSSWAPLDASTLAGKQDRRKFVYTGAVLEAITKNAEKGKLNSWGSFSDISAKGKFRNKKYKAGGIFAMVSPFKDGMTVVIGFNGRLRHSAAFNKVRKQLAADRGVNFAELKGSRLRRAINAAVSVGDVQGRINVQRKRPKKFAIAKAKRKGVTNNLAYANVVQAGGSNTKGKKTPRPLMPFQSADSIILQRAIENRVAKVLKQIEKG